MSASSSLCPSSNMATYAPTHHLGPMPCASMRDGHPSRALQCIPQPMSHSRHICRLLKKKKDGARARRRQAYRKLGETKLTLSQKKLLWNQYLPVSAHPTCAPSRHQRLGPGAGDETPLALPFRNQRDQQSYSDPPPHVLRKKGSGWDWDEACGGTLARVGKGKDRKVLVMSKASLTATCPVQVPENMFPNHAPRLYLCRPAALSRSLSAASPEAHSLP
jgi:hypothetical protein